MDAYAAPTSELDDINEDIELNATLLASLDDDLDTDAEESRRVVSRTLKRLRRRAEQLQSARDQGQVKQEPARDQEQVKQEPARDQDQVKQEPAEMTNESSSLPSSLVWQVPMPPPDFDLVSRKRQRDDLADDRRSKSRKQSPNTSDTVATSPAPSADSGSFDFDDPILGSLLPGYSREDEEDNKAFLWSLEERTRQEEQDAAFARRLQWELNEEPEPTTSLRKPAFSAFPPASSTQSLFRADGTINRKLPRPPGMAAAVKSEVMKAEPSQTGWQLPGMAAAVKPEVMKVEPSQTGWQLPGMAAAVKPEVMKAEPSQTRWQLPEDSLPSPAGDDDSPVEEISAQEFESHYKALNRMTGSAFNPSWPPYGPAMPGAFSGAIPYGSLGGAPVYGMLQRSPYGGVPGFTGTMNGALTRSSLNPFDVDTYGRSLMDPVAESAQTEEQIKNLMKQIRPDEELTQAQRSEMPEGLKIPLMPHQAAGVAWMKRIEAGTNKGGILADDMGLGKTLQTIALMLARPAPADKHQPNLIVAPLALLRQWESELAKFVDARHRFRVLILHGPNKPTKWSIIRAYDIIITTYSTLAAELKRKLLFDEKLKMIPDAVPTGKEECPILGNRSKFHRVVLDEAQNIKNRTTKAAVAACLINATHRWCLTGTPMQNNTDEMYSLIKFCNIPPFSNWDKFKRDISQPLKKADVYESTRNKAMEALQALLRAIMLRRNKKSEIDGQPIIQLPDKNTVEDRAHFDKDQLEFYRNLETKSQIQFNKYLRAGTVGQNYSNALVMLLRLRQACCHPHLITNSKDFIQANGVLPDLSADYFKNAKALQKDVVARLKASEAFECPVCMDANENPVVFPCGHAICNDCLTRLTDNALNNEEGSRPLCPACRARIDATKITNLSSFLRVHCPGDERLKTFNEEDADNVDSDSSDDIDESDSGGDLDDFIVADDDDIEYASDASKPEKDAYKRLLKEHKTSSRSSSKSRTTNQGKGKGKAKVKGKSLAELRKEGLRSKAAKKKYLKKLSKDYVPSAKIDKTIALLEEIRNRGEGEKTIVFSSFTSFLDLLEVPLWRHPDLNHYKRFDGSMSRVDREDAVHAFQEDRNCKVMLVSLKAGNAGLNLTVANHVIILDPFWNPFVEYQAADRCYRIGQMREVTIHRILIGEEGRDYGNIGEEGVGNENNFTVEDRILTLQEKKKKLVETALDERAGERLGRLGVRELGYLFGVNRLD